MIEEACASIEEAREHLREARVRIARPDPNWDAALRSLMRASRAVKDASVSCSWGEEEDFTS